MHYTINYSYFSYDLQNSPEHNLRLKQIDRYFYKFHV
jgi:hypothetical protein